MPHRAWTPTLLQNFQNSTRSGGAAGGGGGGWKEFLYVCKGEEGERERVGLVSLGIKPGDRSHRRLPEPVGISESPRRASAPVFRCIEKEAGVLTLGDGPGEAR